ncbi:MAG TPA: SigE family RNA polymerase sigma factor [Mycobacteriales bacterium]|nr:SigE family RNA polymerase sigma factor [Mycobacteriales bacterium]
MDRDAEDDYREFVTARSPALLGTAYLLTGDRGLAEDLLQATLLQVYRHWSRIVVGGDPESYVRRALANQRISWWRRRRVSESVTGALPDQPVPDAAAGLAERDEMWRALQHLPARVRAVLVLRYWEDLTEAETARVLGCSVGTVKSQSSRGIRRLREVLAGPDPEPEPAASYVPGHGGRAPGSDPRALGRRPGSAGAGFGGATAPASEGAKR